MIAELHPTFSRETTPIGTTLDVEFIARRAEERRAGLRVLPGGDLPHVPRCRPTERRLRILNNGTGVSGAIAWNA